MSSTLPTYAPLDLVQERLRAIFPEGVANRNWLTREMAAKTVFTMIYIGAIEGADRYLAPVQVVRMSDEQAALVSDTQRIQYAEDSIQKKYVPRGTSWYAMNSREPIRDEGLRYGLIPCGAAGLLYDVPTTSSRGRYYLAADFAALFLPELTGTSLIDSIEAWRKAHMSAAAFARIAIITAGAAAAKSGVEVRFPSGEGRRLGPGSSSVIAKAVIEEFTERFLEHPAVVWVSESGKKVVHRDDLLARRIHLNIEATKVLPDIILADVAGDAALLVFVEVVSTDGPINDVRRGELMALAAQGGYSATDVAFVTAFMDRDAAPLKRTLDALAWNSFVWTASEPDGLMALVYRKPEARLSLRALMSRRS